MVKRILFVCVHNSARSQMAEAFLRHHGGDGYIVESAGLEPTSLDPYVVEAMKERGIDISDHQTTSVFDVVRSGRLFNRVITVCDDAASERCPIFPGVAYRLHWPFPDPTVVEGDEQRRRDLTREVRDQIEKKIVEFVEQDTECC